MKWISITTVSSLAVSAVLVAANTGGKESKRISSEIKKEEIVESSHDEVADSKETALKALVLQQIQREIVYPLQSFHSSQSGNKFSRVAYIPSIYYALEESSQGTDEQLFTIYKTQGFGMNTKDSEEKGIKQFDAKYVYSENQSYVLEGQVWHKTADHPFLKSVFAANAARIVSEPVNLQSSPAFLDEEVLQFKIDDLIKVDN